MLLGFVFFTFLVFSIYDLFFPNVVVLPELDRAERYVNTAIFGLIGFPLLRWLLTSQLKVDPKTADSSLYSYNPSRRVIMINFWCHMLIAALFLLIGCLRAGHEQFFGL
jgi:hypothetical protein